MADFTRSRSWPGAVYPIDSVDTSTVQVAPLITPDQLRLNFLFGIPLVSRMPNPLTGRADVMTDEILNSFINRAIDIAQTELNISIYEDQKKERKPYDYNLLRSQGYFRTDFRPIQSVQNLQIETASGLTVWDVPLEWLDMGYANVGQLYLYPFFCTVDGHDVAGNPNPNPFTAGGLFLQMQSYNFVGGYWTIKYTTGFPCGKVPSILNELIGTIAAMEILSQIAATWGFSSGSSLSIDGLSQSVSTPGVQVFAQRLSELQQKRDMLTNKIRGIYTENLLIGTF